MRLATWVLALAVAFPITVRAAPPDAGSSAPVPHVDVALRWSRGVMTLVKWQRGEHPAPPTRAGKVRFDTRGRFAARLLVDGHETPGDPSRFDFPLLADADAGIEEKMAERIVSNVTSEAMVRLPLAAPVDRLTLVVVDSKSKIELRAPLVPPVAAPVAAPSPKKP